MTLKEKIEVYSKHDEIDFGISITQIESGENISINADAPFPTASVFKVPVMVEVFRQAQLGNFDLDDRLELKSQNKTLTSGVLLHLQDGLKPTIRDLVMLMIIISDNTATSMLMDLVGPENITATMHSLGLYSIHVRMNVHEMFLHAFGIPEQTTINIPALRERAKEVFMDYGSRTFSLKNDNNISSAADMTRLMTAIYKGEIVNRAACDEMLEILSHQQINDRVPLYLPWYSVYNKTGTMQGVRNDSGIMYCSDTSHVAYSIFSFDHIELPYSNPRFSRERARTVSDLMGEMGLEIYKSYGGMF